MNLENEESNVRQGSVTVINFVSKAKKQSKESQRPKRKMSFINSAGDIAESIDLAMPNAT